jgi:hypothetical protein
VLGCEAKLLRAGSVLRWNFPAPEVGKDLSDFSARVHDEWATECDRLIQRSGQEE